MTIDILRGFALLGVILVNTWSFQGWGLPWRTQYTEVWTGSVDHAAMWMIVFFASYRFISLFSFLFGLGFAMQFERARELGVPFAGRHLRRMLILFLFGLLHAMLQGSGDILCIYAFMGSLLFLFRNRTPKTLLAIAAFFVLLPWAVGSVREWQLYDSPTARQVSEQVLQGRVQRESTMRARREELVQVRREGTLGDNVAYNLKDFAPGRLQLLNHLALVMFFLGLYAGRRKILENPSAHLPLIRKLLWWGLGLGLVGISVSLTLTRVLPDPPPLPYVAGRVAVLFQDVGAIAGSLFYASGIVLLLRRTAWERLLAPLAAVGRMPLTNYLLHTVIHVGVFFGSVGFGLYGRVSPAATVGVSLLMYGFMIVLSQWWMGRFRFGPAEWLWRTLTYGRLQPMRASHTST